MKLTEAVGHPHTCAVCNSGPVEGEKFIDTEVYFTDPMARHLKGTRYVCEKCAAEISALVPNKPLDKAKAEVRLWKGKYGELAAALDGLTKSLAYAAD